jgi:hypothetical protein
MTLPLGITLSSHFSNVQRNGERSAEQVERIFAAMESESVQALHVLLAHQVAEDRCD